MQSHAGQTKKKNLYMLLLLKKQSVKRKDYA